MVKQCAIEGCVNRSKSRGLCPKHAHRMKKFGDPHFSPRLTYSEDSICCVEECSNRPKSRGMCDKHYARFKASGDPDSPSTKRSYSDGSVCQVDECTKPPKSLGYCRLHYERFRSTGDPLGVRKVAKHAEGTTCKVDSCGGKVVGQDLCNKHYLRFKNHGDPLGGGAFVFTRKVQIDSNGEIRCPECERTLPTSEFHKDNHSPSGFRARCKACHTSQVKNWYQKNAERQRKLALKRYADNIAKMRSRDKERYEKDKEKRLELASKHSQIRRARKKSGAIDRGISKNRLRKIFGDNCYYCGIEMNFAPATERKYISNHATIEHIIPLSNGGTHTWENVVLACRSCNLSKGSKDESDWNLS